MTVRASEGWRGSVDVGTTALAAGSKAALDGWAISAPGSWPVVTAPSGAQTMKYTTGGNGTVGGSFSWVPRKLDGSALVPGSGFIIGFRAQWVGTMPSGMFIIKNWSGNQAVWVNLHAPGPTWDFVNRAALTEGTSTGTPGDGLSHYYEFKVTGFGTTGTLDVHLDNASIYSDASFDYNMSGDSSGPRFEWYSGTGSGDSITLSDIVLLDLAGTVNNDFLGDVHVETKFPTGDGTHLDFTPTPSGAHYSTVNEHPAVNTATYVQSNAVGAKDTYTHEAMISTGAIKAIVVYAVAEKTDTGPCGVKGLVRSGTSDATGSTEYLLAYNTYTNPVGTGGVSSLVRGVIETNPATSGVWTTAAADASEIGTTVTTA